MSVSPIAIQHMASLAEEMAKSGKYPGVSEIENELVDRCYPDAREWLADPRTRERVERLCKEAQRGDARAQAAR